MIVWEEKRNFMREDQFFHMRQHDRAHESGHKAKRNAHEQQIGQISKYGSRFHPQHRSGDLTDIVRGGARDAHAEQRTELSFRVQQRPHDNQREQTAEQRKQERRHAAHEQGRERHANDDDRERIAQAEPRQREQRYNIREAELDAGIGMIASSGNIRSTMERIMARAVSMPQTASSFERFIRLPPLRIQWRRCRRSRCPSA